jgi:phage recombination protein Bet
MGGLVLPDRERIELIKRTVAKDTTDDELKLFLHVCDRAGLDPLARQIYCIKRWDNRLKSKVMSIQVSIDGMRSIASDTGEMAGQRGPYWCGTEGLWDEVWLGDEPPKAAKVVVLRGAGDEYTGIAHWSSYKQLDGNGNLSPMWSKMPAEMLAKCAEAQALRRAFPRALSGLYSTDEMAQADRDYALSGSVSDSERPRDGIPTLPPPRPSGGHSGGNAAMLGAVGEPEVEPEEENDMMRRHILTKLNDFSADEVTTLASNALSAGLRNPDEASFSVRDGNGWLALMRGVRHASERKAQGSPG